MDFSQDFADELPEIHVGKTDEVYSTNGCARSFT